MSHVEILQTKEIFLLAVLMLARVANVFAAAPRTSSLKETELYVGSNAAMNSTTEQASLTLKSGADFGNDLRFKVGLDRRPNMNKQPSAPLPPSPPYSPFPASPQPPSPSPPPLVHSHATYAVNRTSNIIYARAVVCRVGCSGHTPGNSTIPGFNASENCICPSFFNLTLDVYAPVGAEGLRPGFVAIHSGE